MTLPAKRMVSRGDGVYLLRLRGEARGKQGRVMLSAKGFEVRCSWPRDADEVVIPIVHLPGRPDPLECRVQGVRLEGAELVCDFDLDGGEVLELQEPESADGWAQVLSLPTPASMKEHSALWIRASDSPPRNTIVELELLPEDEGREPEELGRFPIAASGSLLVTMGNPEGRWLGVRVKGAGQAPADLFLEAKIVTLPGE